MASQTDAMTYAQKWKKAKGVYRKVFGHRSPYRRIYGGRDPGQALDVTMKEVGKIKGKMKEMKERLNVEKKHIDDVHSEALNVGQVANTSSGFQSGHRVLDVTPAIAQGTDFDERTGNSLKFTGFNFKVQLMGQTNTVSSRKVRFTLVRVACASDTPEHVFTKMFDPNPLTSLRFADGDGANADVYDLQAPLNYTNLKSMGIKVLAKRTFYVPGTQHIPSADKKEVTHKTCSFSVKLNDVARYQSSSEVEPENFRYYLFVQSDVGNRGNVTVPAGGTYPIDDIPITTLLSGITCRFHSRIWYVDN